MGVEVARVVVVAISGVEVRGVSTRVWSGLFLDKLEYFLSVKIFMETMLTKTMTSMIMKIDSSFFI
jgi:hypothetical protein